MLGTSTANAEINTIDTTRPEALVEVSSSSSSVRLPLARVRLRDASTTPLRLRLLGLWRSRVRLVSVENVEIKMRFTRRRRAVLPPKRYRMTGPILVTEILCEIE